MRSRAATRARSPGARPRGHVLRGQLPKLVRVGAAAANCGCALRGVKLRSRSTSISTKLRFPGSMACAVIARCDLRPDRRRMAASCICAAAGSSDDSQHDREQLRLAVLAILQSQSPARPGRRARRLDHAFALRRASARRSSPRAARTASRRVGRLPPPRARRSAVSSRTCGCPRRSALQLVELPVVQTSEARVRVSPAACRPRTW